ncbi:hypothetical protein EVAR_81033_1 [Eumeta japonica]|uniref:Uncharacterized protein n=1 Tax=Eumeta variegata TaxID=151549 RepID=A0A4C1T5R5_EUMVA|nr:hypothetical protein EVAR_81033_1 [Eumeta japonica]
MQIVKIDSVSCRGWRCNSKQITAANVACVQDGNNQNKGKYSRQLLEMRETNVSRCADKKNKEFPRGKRSCELPQSSRSPSPMDARNHGGVITVAGLQCRN